MKKEHFKFGMGVEEMPDGKFDAYNMRNEKNGEARPCKGKSTSKVAPVMVTIMIWLFAIFSMQAQPWQCGANLTATLSGTTLTISGTGEMNNYTATNMPWYSNRNAIQTLVIESGVGSIGENAFRGLSQISSLTMFGGYILATGASLADSVQLASICNIFG